MKQKDSQNRPQSEAEELPTIGELSVEAARLAQTVALAELDRFMIEVLYQPRAAQESEDLLFELFNAYRAAGNIAAQGMFWQALHRAFRRFMNAPDPDPYARTCHLVRRLARCCEPGLPPALEKWFDSIADVEPVLDASGAVFIKWACTLSVLSAWQYGNDVFWNRRFHYGLRLVKRGTPEGYAVAFAAYQGIVRHGDCLPASAWTVFFTVALGAARFPEGLFVEMVDHELVGQSGKETLPLLKRIADAWAKTPDYLRHGEVQVFAILRRMAGCDGDEEETHHVLRETKKPYIYKEDFRCVLNRFHHGEPCHCAPGVAA